MKPRVYVPEPILPAVVDRLREQFEIVDGLFDKPEGVLSTITFRVDKRFLEAAGPALRIVANYGVGVNNIDLAAAAESGVIVTNTPDVLTAATAELAVGLMLALLRRIVEGDRMLRAQQPWEFALDFMLGHSLAGKTLLIVGPGRIGRATAELAVAFGAKPIFAGRGDALDDLLGDADIVSIHAPLTDATRRLFDAARIARMKPTAVLVNTSRGPLIDEEALADALDRGALAGAALDVFEREPLVSERLLRLENVVLTPHIGSATRSTREAMGFLAVRSLREFLIEGRAPATVVAG